MDVGGPPPATAQCHLEIVTYPLTGRAAVRVRGVGPAEIPVSRRAPIPEVALADLEQVEVLKGPISVLYGTGSTGGVLNVIPYSGKFASAPRWTLATTTAGESAARGFTGYSRAGLNSPNFYLMLSQSYRDHDSYRAGGGERILNSQFRDYQSYLATSRGFALKAPGRNVYAAWSTEL